MAVPQVLQSNYSGEMSLEADDNEDPTGDGSETHNRSERKRQREKQRRSDLSNAFDELAAFIAHVEPEAGVIDLEGKKKRKKSCDGDDSSGVTRLELIGRALKVMKRLHRENGERKRIISTMQERGGSQGTTDNVLVMVPTLTPMEDNTYPVARASYPTYPPPSSANYYHQSHSLPPQGCPMPPQGGPQYAVPVPHGGRVQPNYAPSNWYHPSYGGPPLQHQQPPPGMEPGQHPSSPGRRIPGDQGLVDRQ